MIEGASGERVERDQNATSARDAASAPKLDESTSAANGA
jgi:hypothetical protein